MASTARLSSENYFCFFLDRIAVSMGILKCLEKIRGGSTNAIRLAGHENRGTVCCHGHPDTDSHLAYQSKER